MSKAIPIMQLKEHQFIYDGVIYVDIPNPHSEYLRKWVPELKSEGFVYKQEHIIAETKYAMLLENPVDGTQKWFKKSELALLNNEDNYVERIDYNSVKSFRFDWFLVSNTIKHDYSNQIVDYRETGEELLGIEDLC